MPTQRPFFTNFFAAFRARSSPTYQAKSSTTTGAVSPSTLSAAAHVSTTTTTVPSQNAARTIATKAGQDSSSHNTNTSPSQPIKSSNASHFTTALAGSPGTTFYGIPKSTRPPSPGPHGRNLAISPGHTTPISRGRQRRDSGSSNTSGGFMDAMGTEKWYIGGRTATGEERFYQLGLVTNNAGKRVRSLDRLSL